MDTQTNEIAHHGEWMTVLAERYPDAERDAGGRFVRFDSAADERKLAAEGPAILERADRCLLRLTGKDRTTWLHGLTTNHVTGLDPGIGNYAFICNVQGRIVFDAVVVAMKDEIWLDIAGGAADAALNHMQKVLIVEDVSIDAAFEKTARLALCGEGAADVLKSAGATQAGNVPHFGAISVELDGYPVTAIRNEAFGLPMFDLFVPVEGAVAVWNALADTARPIGCAATEAHRIMNGRPRFGREITDEYLPAETRQLDLAVSFNKGCYLGQEVVARMHAHDAVARLLVGIDCHTDAPFPQDADIRAGGKVVGEVTSAWHDSGQGRVRALGYVKTAAAEAGKEIEICHGDTNWSAVITDWPPSA